MKPLVVNPCKTLCDWGRSRAESGGEPLFVCTGCGSQWRPSEQWTPIDHTGKIPDDVLAIRKGITD